MLVVCCRLFEAHFLPVHLVLVLVSSQCYGLIYPNFLLPWVLRSALELAGWCRLIGYCLMLCAYRRYEQYHRLCVDLRVAELQASGLLDIMAERDEFSPDIFLHAGICEAMLFPIGGFLYGAIPAIHAELSHLFTERLEYRVSVKA